MVMCNSVIIGKLYIHFINKFLFIIYKFRYNNNFINDPNTQVTSIPTRKMSITSSANSESVIWLSIDDQVSIRTIVSIDHYTHNMKYTVSIKNIANETLRNVTYNRIFDPDLRKYRYYELHANTDDIMGVFETYNYVKYQANSAAISDESLNKFVRSTEPLESLVWATSQEMDKHIGIGAINSHSKVGFCPLVNAVTLYTNFITLCADTEWEPYGGVTIDNGMIEDMSHSDDFLYLNMLYPIIQPGEIFSFSYYYLLNITEEEVVVTDTTRLIIAQPTEILTGTNSLVVIYSTDLFTVLELLVFGAANTWESIGNYTYESENIQIISAFNSSRSYYCYNIYLDSTQYSDETNVHMKAVAHVGDEKLSAHKSISIANTGRSSCDDAYLGFSVDSPVVSLRSCDTTDHDATILSVKYYREIFVDGVEIASTYVGESTSYPYIAHVRIDDLLSSINSENLYPIYVKAVVTRMVNNEVYETAVVFSGYFNDADIDSPTANIVFYYIVAGVSSAVVLAAIAYGYRVYNPLKSKTDTKQQYINDDIPELKSDIFNYNSSFKSSSNQTSLTTTPASSPSSSMKKASLVTVNDAAKPIENEIYFEFDTVYPVNEHFL